MASTKTHGTLNLVQYDLKFKLKDSWMSKHGEKDYHIMTVYNLNIFIQIIFVKLRKPGEKLRLKIFS